MDKIVIIPCFRRPEFLHVCIEQILNADGANECKYMFAPDTGFDKTNTKIIQEFPLTRVVIEHPAKISYKLTKQSFNLLHAYILAATQGDALIYMIEEDIFIGKDFFTFHEQLHEKENNIFCSVLTKNHNTNYKVTDNENAYYLSDKGDYQSLGVCFRSEIINTYIKPYYTKQYFLDPIRYCEIMFPKSKIGKHFVEQDGLIRRIIEANKMSVAFSHVPRAFHAGYYGYNRTKNLPKNMNLNAKIMELKKVCFSKEIMRQRAENDHFYFDSEPVNLNTEHTNLINIPCQN